MEPLAEYAAVIENREHLYRLLGRLYLVEADQALLDQIRGMVFPAACSDDELDAGYRMLETFLRRPGLDPLTDLAVDYAKVFLGAGVAKNGFAAYPYESVYTSPERLVMQDARDKVLAEYRSKGLDKIGSLDVPEDHIALELAFMAHLCSETRRFLAAKDWPAVLASLRKQEEFVTRHLLGWAPEFCGDVLKCAETDFYKAVAHLTNAFLRLDRAILEDLIAEPIGAAA